MEESIYRKCLWTGNQMEKGKEKSLGPNGIRSEKEENVDTDETDFWWKDNQQWKESIDTERPKENGVVRRGEVININTLCYRIITIVLIDLVTRGRFACDN